MDERLDYPASEMQGIDAQIARESKCPECSGPMHYEREQSPSSYRAFAVCDNAECGTEFEF